jgi:hypothetical protein
MGEMGGCRGKEGEKTQTLCAHMNKRNFFKKKKYHGNGKIQSEIILAKDCKSDIT